MCKNTLWVHGYLLSACAHVWPQVWAGGLQPCGWALLQELQPLRTPTGWAAAWRAHTEPTAVLQGWKGPTRPGAPPPPVPISQRGGGGPLTAARGRHLAGEVVGKFGMHFAPQLLPLLWVVPSSRGAAASPVPQGVCGHSVTDHGLWSPRAEMGLSVAAVSKENGDRREQSGRGGAGRLGALFACYVDASPPSSHWQDVFVQLCYQNTTLHQKQKAKKIVTSTKVRQNAARCCLNHSSLYLFLWGSVAPGSLLLNSMEQESVLLALFFLPTKVGTARWGRKPRCRATSRFQCELRPGRAFHWPLLTWASLKFPDEAFVRNVGKKGQ